MFCGFMAKLTRFERTRLLSARMLQLALGAPPLVKMGKGASIADIARGELDSDKIPLAVLREFPDGRIERVDAS